MKKVLAVLVICILALSIGMVLKADIFDDCHAKCAKKYPKDFSKYSACMYGCLPPSV